MLGLDALLPSLLIAISVALSSPSSLSSASSASSPSPVRYIGVDACASCHADIARRWRETPHARAYETLVEDGRQDDLACVACHVTGLGHWTGFRPDGTRLQLAGVQCESCHGTGSVHARLPSGATIRREVPETVCRGCHTIEQSPKFSSALDAYRRSGEPHGPSLAPPDDPVTASVRATIDIFVMGLCPFAADFERQLAAALDGPFRDRVDIRFRYVVRDAGEEPPTGAPRLAALAPRVDDGRCLDDGEAAGADCHLGFASLHGADEVREDLRQLAVARLAPERLFDYMLARAGDLHGDWRPAAVAAGLDPHDIEQPAAADIERLRADARLADRLAIRASPTMLVNGARVDGAADAMGITRHVCAGLVSAPPVCDSLPACTRHGDCRARGMEGRCVEPGTARARCVFTPPAPVTLHVLNDPGCGLCNPAVAVAAAMELFPALRVEAHDVTTADGAAWA